MATASNQRDVRLGVEIETAGEDSLKRLAAEVRALAKDGGDAAPQYARLADEIDRLGQQAKELNAFKELGADLAVLNAETQQAVQRAAQLREQYDSQAAAVAAARGAQASLREQINAVTKDLAENRKELEQLRAGLAAGTVADGVAAESKERLGNAAAVLRERLTGLKADLKIADAATSDAARGFSALGTAAESAATQALQAQRTFAQQNQALQEAAGAAARAGLGVTDLAAAQAALDAAMRGSVAQITAIASATEQLALAEREAAAAVETELAAIRESEAFVERYAVSKAAASAAALEYVLAIEREAVAQEKASRRQAELNAQSEATAARLRREAEIVAVLEAAEREAAASKAALIEADRLLAIETAALAAARQRGAQALQAENTAIAEAAALTQRYEVAQRLAREEALRLVEAEDAKAASAEKASRRQAELNAQSEKTAQDAKYVRDLEQALAAVEREAQQAATATARLQSYFEKLGKERDLVDKAFGTTGVRSIQTIEQEMFRLNQSLQVLQSELRQGNISMQDFERASGSAALRLAALKREIDTVPGNASVFNQLADGANALITRFGALTAAVATAGFAFKPLIDATIALDQTRRVLTTVSGSAEQAAAQIDFLRRVSQQAGQQFDQIAQSYSKFAASALQSGLSLQQVQDVFQSVSLAAGNLGLSTDQTKRALEALGQIASKGTVSMEELRQQLGDALPGVLPLLAKELGLTQRQLNQVVESGNLMAREAIPAIGRSLQQLQAEGGGRVEGLVASWNRFINVVKQAGVEIVEGPLGVAAGTVLTAFAGAIRDVSVVAVSANEAFKLFGLTTLSVLDALKGNITFEQLKQQVADFADQSATKIRQFKDTAYGVEQATSALSTAVKPLGESYAALAIKIEEADRAAQLNARTSEMRAQAVAKEAEAIKLLADLSPNEADAAALRLEAAQNYAVAANAAAAAATAEADALRRGRDAMLAKAGANAEELKALEEVLKKRGEEIQKADAAAEKLNAVATAARNAAAAAADTAAKVGDQSGKLTELAAQAISAERAYEALVRRFNEGKATTEELRAGKEALARATGLLKDALNDLSEALQRRLGLMRAENELQRQGLQLELEKAKTALRAAQDAGNETAARNAFLRIKELEIALTRKAIDIKKAEAEVELKALGALEENLRASGQLTEAKAIEIETRRKLLQAVILESAAKEEAGKQSVQELENLRSGRAARDENSRSIDTNTGRLTSNTSASSSNTSSIQNNTSARRDNAAATQQQTTALERWEQRLAQFRGLDGGVSGNGVAGIGPSQNGVDFGVRSAGGSANKVNGLDKIESFGDLIRSTPSGGITRTVNGQQLQPPTNDGKWEFVNDQGDTAFQRADSVQHVVPGVGYWRRTDKAPGGPGSFAVPARPPAPGSTPVEAPTPAPTPAPAPTATPSRVGPPVPPPATVNPDGTTTITFNFGIGRNYRVTADSYTNALALARELEQQFKMQGGGT